MKLDTNIIIRFSDEDVAALKYITEKTFIKRSVVIRTALRLGLEQLEETGDARILDVLKLGASKMKHGKKGQREGDM